ncbi:TrbC/VirB2 family protein [Streptococcus mutans]|uniref:TrbC/VirB2 family protein n=1 Tax=Streptococcus mutans TaxID=1309 RepID=UPI001425E049|nr:TrbC/VirB2 family protein [Streptococcus mutans]QIQ93131.1 conjugal transfer protein TrbC [Streptococcus mutans]QIQ99372.1 conjugal transfer protein TrbC [Streptococcus mutans]QIR02848.1 conjugal transfer protein TrbC [Streptococcus mutans]QIR03151.1 conjugal transfer protein TrbC [Streptococcus mutans]
MKNKLTNFIDKVKTKGKGYLLSLSLFLSGLTNTAYAEDPFAKSKALSQQGITKVQGIGVVTLGLAVVVTGLIYGFGGREVKATIKKHWVSIAISIIAVSAGPSIIEWGFNFVKG